MNTNRKRICFAVLLLIGSTVVAVPGLKGASTGDPPNRDAILDWNAIAIAAVADDYSNIYGAPDQKGPTRTSRALAIVHLAMFDAANMITPRATPYLSIHKPTTLKVVSLDAAVAQAAADTLTELYPKQRTVFAAALTQYLAALTNTTQKNWQIGDGMMTSAGYSALRTRGTKFM